MRGRELPRRDTGPGTYRPPRPDPKPAISVDLRATVRKLFLLWRKGKRRCVPDKPGQSPAELHLSRFFPAEPYI
jgi:hypothetical protein